MNPIIVSLIVVLALNLVVYPIAYKLQTDKLTDITYSLSFICLIVFGFVSGSGFEDMHKIILAVILMAWSVRIGYFLLRRVIMMGRDKRFDEIRTNPLRFLRFFVLQAIASWVISIPFLYYFFHHEQSGAFSQLEIIGWIIAIIGLMIESVADAQKSNYKAMPGNSEKLYTGGLYKSIRYPNYTGEILFWVGICVACADVYFGWRWLSIISPVFITLLLIKVSGIPFLEKGRKKKYGNDPEYIAYTNSTKLLIPGIY